MTCNGREHSHTDQNDPKMAAMQHQLRNSRPKSSGTNQAMANLVKQREACTKGNNQILRRDAVK